MDFESESAIWFGAVYGCGCLEAPACGTTTPTRRRMSWRWTAERSPWSTGAVGEGVAATYHWVVDPDCGPRVLGTRWRLADGTPADAETELLAAEGELEVTLHRADLGLPRPAWHTSAVACCAALTHVCAAGRQHAGLTG